MLSQILNISQPVIMAPMFLVSNVKMVKAAIDAGITGAIPALNFHKLKDLEDALIDLNSLGKTYGINLVVNKSNYKLDRQLELCIKYRVPFIITSLGSPKKVIQSCRPHGIKVFCDVSDMNYARKAAQYKPDALIAVLNNAGGHHGKLSAEEFIPQLIKEFPTIPIISAGGVGDYNGINKMLDLGACGVSVGSIFIASEESNVSHEYKQACVDYGSKDIVSTTKISGVPCTVINTPYVQQMGLKENWIEKFLNKNKRFKKWLKMLVYRHGMSLLEKAAFSANYKKVWCAGPTIEFSNQILPVKEIVKKLTQKS